MQAPTVIGCRSVQHARHDPKRHALRRSEIPSNFEEHPMNTASVISSDKVEGTTVYNPEGEKLGSIDDLMIDRATGQVRYAVLEFGGFLGMGTDRYPIPWSMLKYDDGRSGYIVPLDKARLEKAPRYSDERVPTYDSEYGQRVNTYYETKNWS
jgi:sporulation protein YlmC with PRC-barrel domain